MSQSAPAALVKKKPFIVRWGNLILFPIAIFLFLAGFPTPSGASYSTQEERAVYGIIYIICVAGIFTLSIVRIVKKHNWLLSILWMLIALGLLFLTPAFWAPRNDTNSPPVNESSNQGVPSEAPIRNPAAKPAPKPGVKPGSESSAMPTPEPVPISAPTPAPAPTQAPTVRPLIYSGNLTLTAQNSFHCSGCGADSPVNKADITLTMNFSDLKASDGGSVFYKTGNFQYSCSVVGPKDNLSDSYSGTLEDIYIGITHLSGGQSYFDGQEGIYFALDAPPFKYFDDKCAGKVPGPSNLAGEALGASHNHTDGYMSVGYFAKNLVKTAGDNVNFSGTITKESGDSVTNYNGSLQMMPQ